MPDGSGYNEAWPVTSHKVVLPFYAYAALSFLVATILLLTSATSLTGHYFHPHTLAITHIMALGWGTMIILGAGHQLIPVLIEGALYSNKLAYACFALAAVGIPLLSYGFYVFDMGWPAKWGGRLVILAILLFLINLSVSIKRTQKESIHAVFVLTATVWLLITALAGLVLVYNFTYPLLSVSSLDYLPLHAHVGIVGWFLLLVTGVGSRLIPMFLLSKYNNTRLLWWIYGLINGGLLSFVALFLFTGSRLLLLLPLQAVALAICLFGRFCWQAYRQRIRKKMDEPMQVSMLSVGMMALPLGFVLLITGLVIVSPALFRQLAIAYGFVIFFGWITAIILGMTFKTLPFIIWHKVYYSLAGKGTAPNPRDLFSGRLFRWMSISYLAGFLVFAAGILVSGPLVLQAGAALLVGASFLYNVNVLKLLMHKRVVS